MLPTSLQRQMLLIAIGREIFSPKWMIVKAEIDGCLRCQEWQLSLKQDIYNSTPRLRGHHTREGRNKKQEEGEDL